MIPRAVVPEDLHRLARSQAGAVSRTQVQSFSISDQVISRLVRDGFWRSMMPGVYALTPETWMQRAWAGVLTGGDSAVLGMAAAGHLHGLLPPPETISVFTGRRRHRLDRPGWEFIRAGRLSSGEPPKTRLAQTIVDLARVLPDDDVADIVARTVGRRVSLRGVMEVLDETRHPRRRFLVELLEVTNGAESPLEVRYVRDVEKAHRLPVALRQARPIGAYRCDNYYELYGVIVELDGRAFHAGLAASKDAERDNLHLLNGIVTLRFSFRQVAAEPCRVARQVATALRNNGWAGDLTPCRRCGGSGRGFMS